MQKELEQIIKRFRIKDIPKLTPEQIAEHDRQVEERLVNQYKQSKADNFLKLRSLYNEKNVLNSSFKNVEPVSDEFKTIAQKSAQMAKEIASGQRYNIILSGTAGAGKTMLATCVLNYVSKHSTKPTNCLFLSVSELADLAYSQYNREEYERQARYHQLFKDIKDTDVLLLDDLGTESSMQANTQEAANTIQKALFRIGDLMQGKCIIITTNNTEQQLCSIYNTKIVSRLLTSNKEHILNFGNVEDYRKAHN